VYQGGADFAGQGGAAAAGPGFTQISPSSNSPGGESPILHTPLRLKI